MPRPLYFEIHIRPMFREIDQLHMMALFDIDLWSYDSVKTNLDSIDGFLTAPPRDPAALRALRRTAAARDQGEPRLVHAFRKISAGQRHIRGGDGQHRHAQGADPLR